VRALIEASSSREGSGLMAFVPSEVSPVLDASVLAWDIVDEWGDQSFPASDPPANW
jgi:hypothetical protein